jgi:hypothetical protein
LKLRCFGADFTEADKVFIQQLEEKLAGEPALTASVRALLPRMPIPHSTMW